MPNWARARAHGGTPTMAMFSTQHKVFAVLAPAAGAAPSACGSGQRQPHAGCDWLRWSRGMLVWGCGASCFGRGKGREERIKRIWFLVLWVVD